MNRSHSAVTVSISNNSANLSTLSKDELKLEIEKLREELSNLKNQGPMSPNGSLGWNKVRDMLSPTSRKPLIMDQTVKPQPIS